MQRRKILPHLVDLKQNQCSAFALLIDPDKVKPDDMTSLAEEAQQAAVDFIFFGGSLLLHNNMDVCINKIKDICDIPIVLFPGNPAQVSPAADSLLYLSLLSGRNAELLIGQHVTSAPMVRQSGLEILPTGYLVIDGGQATTVSYMSHSSPIPANKPDIALCTAWAGEMQGKQLIYLDAGSGARQAVSVDMIRLLNEQLRVPLIVGGGIRTAEQAKQAAQAGAQVVVVGNALENNRGALKEFVAATHESSNPKRTVG